MQNPAFLPEIGGAGRAIYEVSRRMSEKGQSSTVLTGSANGTRKRVMWLCIIGGNRYVHHLTNAIGTFRKVLTSREKFDVVHSQKIHYPSLFALIDRRRGISDRVVTTTHDSDVNSYLTRATRDKNRKLRILITTTGLYPKVVGGVEVHTYNLIKHLDAMGMNVRTVSMSDENLPGRLTRVLLYRKGVSLLFRQIITLVWLSIGVLVLSTKRIYRWPNLVHSHTALTPMLLGYFASRICHVPLIVTVHGSDVRMLRHNRVLRTVQKIFLARASFVTCVSRDIATILRLDYEVQADRLCVIPNGFDSNLFLKQKFPLNSSLRNEIVTVANLRPEKDVPTLLRAFSLVKKKVPDARLVVIGDGPMRKFLQDLCLELGLSDSVSFKGHMRQVSVFAEITLAKCFVLSSTEEGFPTVIVEAMFAGTPIVATRVGGVPEIIQNGRNGFLVPKNSPKELSDAILEIILDDGLQARMSDEGRRVALSYSWDNIVVGYMRVYRTCISRS